MLGGTIKPLLCLRWVNRQQQQPEKQAKITKAQGNHLFLPF
jgi:hypothetical protein